MSITNPTYPRVYSTFNPSTNRVEIWSTDDNNNFQYEGLPEEQGGGDSDAIAKFLSLAGNDPSQQALVSRLRSGTYSQDDLRGPNGVYSQLAGAGWGGGDGGGDGGSEDTMTTAPTDVIAYQIQLAQQVYLQKRLEQVEIPETEIKKHQLALDAASRFAELSGWVLPQYFEQSLTQFPGVVPGATYQTVNGPMTVEGMEQELKNLGWAGGEDVIAAYARTTGGQVTPQVQQMGYQTMPGGITGGAMRGAIPTIEMANLMGNPRNLAQVLTLMGYTPEQTSQFLRQTPLVQNLMGYPGVSFQGGVTAEGRNPSFPFVSGRQLPVRETMQAVQTQSPLVGLLSGMASYSGQTPESFWGDWQRSLPKGSANPLTRYLS